MDNITHTLLGLAAAEALVTTRQKKARVPLWIASGVANNLPDLDVLFTTFYRGDKVTYLIHHRGFTHTLLLAPVQSALWFFLLRLVWRKRGGLPWAEVGLLCFLGPLLHLLADSWNSYGVHPFWPLDNRWYYGDLTFILEPWIWAILLPVVWQRAHTRLAKGLSLLLLTGVLGAAWVYPAVAWPVALALSLSSLVWLGAQRLLRDDRARLTWAFSALLLVFVSFGFSEARLRAAFAGEGSELALTPQPGNPFCFTALAAGWRGDVYRAAAWAASPWPALVPAGRCAASSSPNLRATREAPTRARVALGEFLGTRAEFAEITRSCRARAFLQFARIPLWKKEGGEIWLGDLRFDRGQTRNFAGISVGGAGEPCPPFSAPWVGRFSPGEP